MSSISRLPESTSRLLGSSIVITTPVTLVKELLDNSIDAKASSIGVIISADTVKKIEVRDNGVGIHPEDYDSLGRRGHTSKLRSFEELRTQSTKTLGFRGEALASANSLAQVTVTTKIASEPVAAILHILPGKGGVYKQRPTSAPIGTTVSITNLFGKLPVREQVIIKESRKAIDNIRQVLRSYAMARPQLRLSLKVLQSPKQNWSYSSKLDASVKEAAVQLFGAEIAAHCFKKTFEISDVSSKYQNPLSNGNYIFESFILKPNCDPSKTPKLRYLSVDGRPIIGKRGTMKKILSIYTEHVGAVFRRSSSATALKDCFIRLNIKCPPGTYDANIEPSKDDVLFSDEDVVLDGFKDLCKEVYGIPTLSNPDPPLTAEHNSISDNSVKPGTQESSFIEQQVQSSSQGVNSDGSSSQTRSHAISQPTFAAQSQQKEPTINHQPLPAHSQEEQQETYSPVTIGFTPINARMSTSQNDRISTGAISFKDISPNTGYARCKVDMSTDLNVYSYDYSRKTRLQPSQAPKERTDAAEYSTPQDVNPWVIAKMNAPNVNKGRAMRESDYENNSSLPVFEPPMTPDPPILRHTGAAPRDLDVPPSQQYLYSQDSPRQLRPRVPGGPYRSPMSSPPEIASQKATHSAKMPSSLRPQRRRDYAPWSPPSSMDRTVPSNDRLVNNDHELISDGMKQTKISFKGARGNSKKNRLEEDNSEIAHQDLQDEESSGENGIQRMLAAARRSLNHQLSQEKDNNNSDHETHQAHVRPKADVQRQPFTQLSTDHSQGGSSSKVKEPIKTTLSNDDPRAYLLRRQKSMAAQEKSAIPKKLRRMKSSLLPLENVPSDDQIHFIMLVEVLNAKTLRASVRGGATYDKYVERGAIKNGLEMDLDTGRKVEDHLKLLLRERRGSADGEETELEIGLCSLLKGKGTTNVA
ncbi:hypothetical protein F4781DRAFT_379354 [Annulohypoxylon bovei var. microspora]|nr:hypothetical protein F4781DRAFT_379354 [Annulohypoxylon bovei var. microspora]